MDNENKRMHSLTLYVVFSIMCLIIYTIVEQILSAVTGLSNDALTTCFFACFGGEILMCGLIKIFKLKEERSNDDELSSDCGTYDKRGF